MSKIKKAVWGIDYDYRADECYARPVCPDCEAPFGIHEDDGKYHCYSCGAVITVTDEKMKEWFKEREGVKTEVTTCIHCGQKTSVDTFRKNYVTLEWECVGGKCTNCGGWFIV